MARVQALQDFLDLALPAMQARAHDGDSPASLLRIAEAVRTVGSPGPNAALLPVCRWLEPALARQVGDSDLAALLSAIRALSPRLFWRRRSGDQTASTNFPDGHANAMLLGPGGIEERRDLWIGLSLLAPRTRYPDHRHAPEETYLVLSPGQFRKNGADWFEPGIGGSFFVPPNAVHAMRSGDEPLFALWALWAGLEGPSVQPIEGKGSIT
ncbi:dimethylsulfonioproprionate lyase family protein [Paracoccus siganidrum]|uniref:Transcriptional regulator n=1 Tax=Paracoccus siganidrum TaxID=1276757 RepID=A0A419A4K0_9RHOB|nr:dimethylsulfonioproprionate lyase family protein [Paracoccus siganidrum]RJL09657.1 transcriptional regulator [Paracoccus siganidrum]RMC35828.1 transcriptional regulator [Paracoccus siganidrum]